MKEKHHACETCAFRKKAVKNPRSIIGRIWFWHSRFCPGWKAYLKKLEQERES